jgi:hypothetical protein
MTKSSTVAASRSTLPTPVEAAAVVVVVVTVANQAAVGATVKGPTIKAATAAAALEVDMEVLVAAIVVAATAAAAVAMVKVVMANNTRRVLPYPVYVPRWLCPVYENCTQHRFFKQILVQMASSNFPIPHPPSQPVDSLCKT